MFKHGMTGKVYRSVREKLNYYKKRIDDKSLTVGQREYAKQRIGELTALNEQSYDEPVMIVTNDKHFGNGIAKPRACVVVGKDDKNRLIVCPVHTRTINSLVLDNDYSHQVDLRGRKIANSEVYELKNISGLKPLTDNDKRKIRGIFAKK